VLTLTFQNKLEDGEDQGEGGGQDMEADEEEEDVVSITKLLLAHGADPCAADKRGVTPLMIPLMKLKAGADWKSSLGGKVADSAPCPTHGSPDSHFILPSLVEWSGCECGTATCC